MAADPSAGAAKGSLWRMMTDSEFLKFQQLIGAETGIHLTEAKQALLMARLGRRLRALGLGSFGEYFELVNRLDEEKVRMIDAISTNETSFFREPRQFDFLREQCIPRLLVEGRTGKRPRCLRVWSAGCSTGEEPYSLAMLLSDTLVREGWEIEIAATDISTRVLDVARTAVWPAGKSSEIPQCYLEEFMLRGVRSQKGKIKAGERIRSVITFGRLNLAHFPYPFDRMFDVIFCRNVLIYFEQALRVRVIHSLLTHLAVGGYLFLGHSETMNGIVADARPVIPNVYAKP